MNANVTEQLIRVKEKGWRRGLGNLLQGEYSAWFKSSRWWKQLILWFSIINLMMIFMMIAAADAAKSGEAGPPILFMYGLFGGMFVAFGVMIIMQRVLVGEKRAGTAAWVLSKPVTRTAFVVSRLAINSIAILLTAVIVPGVILYVTLGLFSNFGWLSPLGFLAGLLLGSLVALLVLGGEYLGIWTYPSPQDIVHRPRYLRMSIIAVSIFVILALAATYFVADLQPLVTTSR